MIAVVMRLVVTASWVVALLLSYQVVESASSEQPLDAGGGLTVTTVQGGAPADQVRRDLTELAQREQITIGQLVPDREDARSDRDLYLAAGDPAVPADAVGGDFGEAMTTTVHQLTDLGLQSLTGEWVVFGEDQGLSLLAEALQAGGAETRLDAVVELPTLRGVPASARPVLVAVGLLLAGTAAAFVVARTRRYAVERLHGGSVPCIWARDVAPLAAVWAGTGVVSLMAAAALTWWRYGGTGLVPFVAQTTVLASVCLGVTVITHALVLAVVSSVDTLGALKGAVPGGALTLSAYVLRGAAVLVALGLAAGTVALTADAAERSRADEQLRQQGDTALVSLLLWSIEHEDALFGTVDPWLQDLDASGDLLIAMQQEIPDPGGGPGIHPVLLVNEPYLAHQPLFLADGGRVDATDQPRMTIPPPLWGERMQVRSDVEELMESQVTAEGAALVEQAAADQRFSALSPPPEVGDGSDHAVTVTDPVVVVVPPGQFDGLVSAATAGELVVRDRAAALADVEADPELATYVRSITPVTTQADLVTTQKAGELRAALFSTAIAYGVVLMAGVAATIAHTTQRAQRILVRRLHGWRIPRIYPVLLAVEAALLVLVLGWAPWQVHRERQELLPLMELGSPPGGLPSVGLVDLVPVVLLALITTGGFCAALAIAHRRVIRHGTSEA